MPFLEHAPEDRFPNFNLTGFLEDKSIDYRVHDSDTHKEVAICCPECINRGEARLDTKYRLWINARTGLFYCYNCDWTGPLPRFIQTIEKVEYDQAIRILRGELLDPLEHLHLSLDAGQPGWYEEVTAPEKEELKEVEFPFGYSQVTGPNPYLEKRGIPWEVARDGEWGTSDVGFCKNRLIVPTFMETRLVFWQARAMWESDEKGFKKVLNPSGVSARAVLYNYDVAKEFKRVILVEGFTDAVKVGENAMATNGKKLHPQQVDWLRKTEAEEIIIMWDADAWTDQKYHRTGKLKGKLKHEASIAQAADLLKEFFEVRLVRLPKDIDPGKLPYKHPVFEKIISRARRA